LDNNVNGFDSMEFELIEEKVTFQSIVLRGAANWS
jgi:hypothetical protein